MAVDIPIGIDLGTTRSLISYIDAIGRPRIIEDLDAQIKLTPSVIMFDKEDELTKKLKVAGIYYTLLFANIIIGCANYLFLNFNLKG